VFQVILSCQRTSLGELVGVLINHFATRFLVPLVYEFRGSYRVFLYMPAEVKVSNSTLQHYGCKLVTSQWLSFSTFVHNISMYLRRYTQIIRGIYQRARGVIVRCWGLPQRLKEQYIDALNEISVYVDVLERQLRLVLDMTGRDHEGVDGLERMLEELKNMLSQLIKFLERSPPPQSFEEMCR